MSWQPVDPDFELRVRSSFASQAFMQTIGASLGRVLPGEVEIRLGASPALTQQHGYVHAGVISSIADSACGYAAYTLMPAGAEVLTVEFKINLLAPAQGHAFFARAKVLRPGRRLTVCLADAFAESGPGVQHIATMTATLLNPKS